ncbi:MAG: NfeD family protein [Pacificimonas sp.]
MGDFGDFLLTPWGWTAMGILLFVLELVIPGVFFMWLGFAALATGLTTLTLGLDLAGQLVSFAVYSIVAVTAGRRFFQRNPGIRSQTTVNALESRYIGKEVRVVEAIEDGRGRVQLGDAPWIAEGDDVPVGTRMRVTAVDGNVLRVERS